MQSQSLIHDDLDIPALTARADLMAADLQQTRVAAGLATQVGNLTVNTGPPSTHSFPPGPGPAAVLNVNTQNTVPLSLYESRWHGSPLYVPPSRTFPQAAPASTMPAARPALLFHLPNPTSAPFPLPAAEAQARNDILEADKSAPQWLKSQPQTRSASNSRLWPTKQSSKRILTTKCCTSRTRPCTSRSRPYNMSSLGVLFPIWLLTQRTYRLALHPAQRPYRLALHPAQRSSRLALHPAQRNSRLALHPAQRPFRLALHLAKRTARLHLPPAQCPFSLIHMPARHWLSGLAQWAPPLPSSGHSPHTQLL